MTTEKCSPVLYVPYESECIPSQSKRNPGYLQELRQDGYRVFDRGNGHADISRPVQLLMTVGEKSLDFATFFQKQHRPDDAKTHCRYLHARTRVRRGGWCRYQSGRHEYMARKSKAESQAELADPPQTSSLHCGFFIADVE